MAWKFGDLPPHPDCSVHQRVQKREQNPGGVCEEETREVQQLREQKALESVFKVSYKKGKKKTVKKDHASSAHQRRLKEREKILNKIKFKLLNLTFCLFTVIYSDVSNTHTRPIGVLLEVKTVMLFCVNYCEVKTYTFINEL